MIEAQLPDGTILEFPDGTDKSVIQRVVKQQLGIDSSDNQSQYAPVQAGEIPASISDEEFAKSNAPYQPQAEEDQEPINLMDEIKGAGETALTTVTKGATGLVGQVLGTVRGITQSVLSGEFGTKEGADKAEKMAMDYASKMSELGYDPETDEAIRNLTVLGDTLGQLPAFMPVAGQAGMAAKAVKPSLDVAKAKALEIPEDFRAVKEIVNVLAGGKSKDQIKNELINDPINAENFDFKLDQNKNVIKDDLAINANRLGVNAPIISTIKTMSNKDKYDGMRMLALLKRGDIDATSKAINRASGIVGDTLATKIRHINDTRKQAGKDLDNIAKKDLNNLVVNLDPAVANMIRSLQEVRATIKYKNGVPQVNLKNSDIQGDTKAESVINNALKNLSQKDKLDARSAHNTKKFIDTQVSYGKRNLANPLTREAENILKSLRRDINESIRGVSETYRKANDIYSETKTTLDNFRDAAKLKYFDLDSPAANEKLGTISRTITSNRNNRSEFIQSIEQADQIAKKYGLKNNDDIIKQVILVNELDRLFNLEGETAFKGLIDKSLEAGKDVTGSTLTGIALKAAEKANAKLKGDQRKKTIEAIEQLLKSQQVNK